ncbi:MAG: helix-turn-helix domain-containing protein [Phycisphaerae bacterium]
MAETTDKIAAIASRIRMAREQAGLSQGQVAKLLDIHRPTVSEIEAGRRGVAADELVRFAELYSVSLNWLAGASNEVADPAKDRVELAARELAKLKDHDLNRVLGLLKSLRQSGE